MASSRRHAAQFTRVVAVVNTDSGTLAFKFTPSASEVGPIPDAGTVRLSLTPSGTEAIIYVEAALTVPLKLTPITVVETPGQTTDVGTALLALTPGGTEFQSTFPLPPEFGTVYLSLTPNEDADPRFTVDAGTVRLSLTPFADEHYCPQKVEFEGDMNVRWVAGIQGRLLAQLDGNRWDSNFLGVGAGYNC